MKYAITPDKKIHQVTDEKEFYENNPDAQDITALPNVYDIFVKQQEAENSASTTVVTRFFVEIEETVGDGTLTNTEEITKALKSFYKVASVKVQEIR